MATKEFHDIQTSSDKLEVGVTLALSSLGDTLNHTDSAKVAVDSPIHSLWNR